MNPRRGWLMSFLFALVALAALPAAAAGGPPSSAPGPVLGVVRSHTPTPFKPVIGAPTAATGASAQNVTFHGGDVMRTNTVYAIYWLPAGATMSSQYEPILDKYFQDVAASSGARDDVYSNDTQYYDTHGSIAHQTTYGGSYVDTANAIPMNSTCASAYTGVTLTGCVSEADERAEISRVLTAAGWTPGSTKEFFLFTPSGVGSCYSPSDCAYSDYCAYHSSFSSGGAPVIWANHPYPTINGFPSWTCDSGEHPNGDVADAAANLVSHEHIESITDPYGSAWWDDADGEEVSDKCAWDFGSPLGSTGSGSYNQVLGTGKYYLQQEWSNASSSCVLHAPLAAPTVTGPAAGSGKVGDEVTITGTGFDDVSAVRFGSATDFTYIVDSPTQITAHVPDGAVTGTIRVTTSGGTGNGPTFKVLPTLDALATTSGAAGTSVTLTGKTLNGTTKVTFGSPTATASIASVTSTSVRVTVPSSAVTGPITVTNAGGPTATDEDFTVLPKLSSFSPSSAGAASSVTINGSGLAGATVTFAGDAAATPTTSTATRIVVPVPADAVTGPIAVATGGGTVSTGTFKPLPRLTAPAALHAGDDLTLAGTNLLGATKLTLSGVSLPVADDSALALDTTVPTSAVTGTLTVTTPAGTASTTLKVLPTIDSFTPDTGVTGTTVTLSGLTLKSPGKVAFAGGATASVKSSSASTLVVTVPSGALTGPITVTNAGGSTTSVDSFTVTPRIGSFSPSLAPANAAVTIYGTGLAGATLVTIGGAAASVDSVSATKIVARVPAAAATGAVAVTTPAGTSTTTTSFRPQPRLGTLPTVQAGDALTVTGTNLDGATRLTLNGSTLTLTPDSGLQVETTVPSNATTGSLTITTPNGSSTATLHVRPTIDSLSPLTARAGQQVTLSGNTLKSPSKVAFAGGATASIRSSSATSIVVTVPSGALTGPVTIWTSGGQTTSDDSFTVLPAVSSFSPTSGAVGTTVKVHGTGLGGATGVSFGGVAATTVDAVSATEVDAVVPPGAAPGQVEVTTPADTSASTGTFTVTFGITGLSPAVAAAGDTVTIDGIGLSGATAVRFGSVPAASFVVVSATRVTAVVPAGATSGAVTVVKGTASTPSAASFTRLRIDSVDPLSAAVGDTITVTGAGFLGTSPSVTFDGIAALPPTVVSDTELQVVVPDGATDGPLRVTTLAGAHVEAAGPAIVPPPAPPA